MSKYCRNCGKELRDDAVFCSGCGISLDVDENKEEVVSVSPMSSYKSAETSNGTILFSPQPLDDEMAVYHKIIWTIIIVQWIALTIALFSNGGFFWGIALGVAISRLEDKKYYNLTGRLRRKKFQFVSGISSEQLLADMNDIFSSKYNYTLEMNKKELVVISNGKMRYEISIEEDNCFTIWYSMPMTRALLSFNNYGDYKKIIAAMGIIAYEIQRRYSIN